MVVRVGKEKAMIVYCNSNNEIKDVGTTLDSTLIPYEIDDTANPFAGWSVAKICCYKVAVSEGRVTMMTPYVDSRLIEHIEQLGQQASANEKSIGECNNGIIETYEGVIGNASSIEDCNAAITELYEMILEG